MGYSEVKDRRSVQSPIIMDTQNQTLIGCLLSETNIITLEYVSRSLSQSIKLLGYESVNIFELEITSNNDLVQSDLILFKISRSSSFIATDILMLEFYNKYYLPIKLETRIAGSTKIIQAIINPNELPIRRSQRENLVAQRVAIPLVSFAAANNFEYNECEDEFVIDPKCLFYQQGEDLEGRQAAHPAWFDHLFQRIERSGSAMTPITFHSQRTSLHYVRFHSINYLPLQRLDPEERLREITMRRQDLLPLNGERQQNRGMLAIQQSDYQDSRASSIGWPMASDHHERDSAPGHLMTQETLLYAPRNHNQQNEFLSQRSQIYEEVNPPQQIHPQHFQQQQQPPLHQQQQQQYQQQMGESTANNNNNNNSPDIIFVQQIPSNNAPRREGPMTSEERLIYADPRFREIIDIIDDKVRAMQSGVNNRPADKTANVAAISPEKSKIAEAAQAAGHKNGSAEAGAGAAAVSTDQQFRNPLDRPVPEIFDEHGRVSDTYIWHINATTGINIKNVYEEVGRKMGIIPSKNNQSEAASAGASRLTGSEGDSRPQNHSLPEVSGGGLQMREMQADPRNQQQYNNLHGAMQAQTGVATSGGYNNFQQPREEAAHVQHQRRGPGGDLQDGGQLRQHQGSRPGPGAPPHPGNARASGGTGTYVQQRPQRPGQHGGARGQLGPGGGGGEPPYMVGGKFPPYRDFRESVNRVKAQQSGIQQSGHSLQQSNSGGQQQLYPVYQHSGTTNNYQGGYLGGNGNQAGAGGGQGNHLRSNGGGGGPPDNHERGLNGSYVHQNSRTGGGVTDKSVPATGITTPTFSPEERRDSGGDVSDKTSPKGKDAVPEPKDKEEEDGDEEEGKADETPVTRTASAEEESGRDGGKAENGDKTNPENDKKLREEDEEGGKEAGDKNDPEDRNIEKEIQEEHGSESKKGTGRVQERNRKNAKRTGQNSGDKDKSPGDSDRANVKSKRKDRKNKRKSGEKHEDIPERPEDCGVTLGSEKQPESRDFSVDVMAEICDTENSKVNDNGMGPRVPDLICQWESRSQHEHPEVAERTGDNTENVKGRDSRKPEGDGDNEARGGHTDDIYEDVEVTGVSLETKNLQLINVPPESYNDHAVPVSSANLTLPPQSNHDSLQLELAKANAFVVPRHKSLSSSIESLDDSSGHFYQTAIRRSVRHLDDHIKDDEAPPLIQTAMFSMLSDRDCKRLVKELDESEQQTMDEFLIDLYSLTNDVRAAISELKLEIKHPEATHDSIWERLNELGQLIDSCNEKMEMFMDLFISNAFSRAVQDWIDRLADTLTEESRNALMILVKYHSTPEQIADLTKTRFGDVTLECTKRRRESLHVASGLTLEINDTRAAVSAPASPRAELSQQFSRLKINRLDNSGVFASEMHHPSQSVFMSPTSSPIGPRNILRKRLTSTPALVNQTRSNERNASIVSDLSSAKTDTVSVSSSSVSSTGKPKPSWFRGLFLSGVNDHITNKEKEASDNQNVSSGPRYSLRQIPTEQRERQAAHARGQSSSSSRSRDRGDGGRETERGLLSKLSKNFAQQGTKGIQRSGKKDKKNKQ